MTLMPDWVKAGLVALLYIQLLMQANVCTHSAVTADTSMAPTHMLAILQELTKAMAATAACSSDV